MHNLKMFKTSHASQVLASRQKIISTPDFCRGQRHISVSSLPLLNLIFERLWPPNIITRYTFREKTCPRGKLRNLNGMMKSQGLGAGGVFVTITRVSTSRPYATGQTSVLLGDARNLSLLCLEWMRLMLQTTQWHMAPALFLLESLPSHFCMAVWSVSVCVCARCPFATQWR